MGWYPKAVRKEVPYRNLKRREPYRAALIHTNGGPASNGSLYGWWSQVARKPSTVGAQFQVKWDGTIEQYVDTDFVVYHAYGASLFAVGIECQDDRDPSRPLSPAQVDAIADLLEWLEVPAQILDGPNPGHGIGWHSKHYEWNKSGHGCPGNVRVGQISSAILPGLRERYAPKPKPIAEDGEFLMDKAAEDRFNKIENMLKNQSEFIRYFLSAAVWGDADPRQGNQHKATGSPNLLGLSTDVAELKKAVDALTAAVAPPEVGA